jgi:hypothetical protein
MHSADRSGLAPFTFQSIQPQVRKASKQAFLEKIMRTDIGAKRKMRQYEHYIQQLSDSMRRLAAIHEQGAKALSRYDIEIAHQGNTEEALKTAKRLLGNQVKYYQRKIFEMKKDNEQLVLL